jgi:glucokinase
MGATIGLDIGGTKVLGVLLADDGNVVREERLASPHTGLDALVATGASIVEQLDPGASGAGAPIGVGAAGLVDRRGIVRYAPNLPNVREAPLRDALAEATGHRVVVDNDASAATLGEVTYGAAVGRRDLLLVTLGTGIGGGFLFDGRMYRGAHNFGAEIGHFTVDPDGPLCACGERGHWEAIASGTALGRLARELVSKGGGAALVAAAGGDPSAVTGTHVGTAAAQGDPDARALLVQYSENVALGLAGLANILDPECIVIAGGLVELGPLLFGPLREAFGRHVEGAAYRPPVEIVPAQLGERAGAIGAAVLARSLLS